MNRLKFLREEKGLYQADIAKLLNVSITAITYYENEKRDIPTDVLKKLSDFYNVSIDFILGKTDIRNLKQENSINEELLQIGFDMKNYNPPNDTQKEQIKALLEVILKDNRKE